MAGVHLPQGARVTEYRCTYSDSSATNDLTSLTSRLNADLISGSSHTTLADVSGSTTGSPGYQSASDTTITSATIDNTM